MTEFRCGCRGEHTAYCQRAREEFEKTLERRARTEALPMAIVSIDPGDRHVGYAFWLPVVQEEEAGVHSTELTPEELVPTLEGMLARYQQYGLPIEVVIEAFTLFENHAQSQAWSKMETSQMIGKVKLLCEQLRVPCTEQQPSIKKPTRAQMRARGIKFRAHHSCGHARDAETHLWHRRLRRKEGAPK